VAAARMLFFFAKTFFFLRTHSSSGGSQHEASRLLNFKPSLHQRPKQRTPLFLFLKKKDSLLRQYLYTCTSKARKIEYRGGNWP
jgi:hypothetical protein